MGYVIKTLAPGEEYIYRARFNWTYDAVSWFWFILSCVPAAIWTEWFFRVYLSPGNMNRFLTAIVILALIAGTGILLKRYVGKWTTVVAITSMRLIMKTGMIARQTHEITLDKIEEVLMHQSALGRVFGYGTITIRGTGVGVIELPPLAQPTRVRREIETARAGFASR